MKGDVSIVFSNLTFTTQVLGDGTLVQVGKGLTLNVNARGMNLSYANGCVTATYQGQTTHSCRSQELGTVDKVIQALPPAVQPVLERLTSASPDEGFMTVEENGSWFVRLSAPSCRGSRPGWPCSSRRTSRRSSPTPRP